MQNYDLVFLKNYQNDTLVNKATVIKRVIEQFDKFLEIPHEDNIIFKNNETIIHSLKLEMEMIKFHAIETLFALCFAFIEQPSDIWNWLNNYKFPEFNRKVAEISKGNISLLFNKDEKIIISEVFLKYLDRKNIDEQQIALLNEKLPLILKLFAKELTENDIYNAFKHGLRLLNGEAQIENESILGVTYLTKKGEILVQQIDYKRSYGKILLAWDLIKLMMQMRKIILREGKGNVQIKDFSKIDLNYLFQEMTSITDTALSFEDSLTPVNSANLFTK